MGGCNSCVPDSFRHFTTKQKEFNPSSNSGCSCETNQAKPSVSAKHLREIKRCKKPEPARKSYANNRVIERRACIAQRVKCRRTEPSPGRGEQSDCRACDDFPDPDAVVPGKPS